ncbi:MULTISPECIES: polyprenyl synthetase family protein [Massilia]|uniref:Polyprenyl synthetase family protein n=1 Tax=Massilia orientalis TaxID=3050128 RepID=A0ACC7M8U7_9BURK|nr:farnesyl diphosphate synthase [Massilia sp. Root133]KQY18712.1 geranyl transferase [Massilia sp. Root133]MDN4041591.1 polyprenyl synthetase family protein [Massilia sp. YIM B02787]
MSAPQAFPAWMKAVQADAESALDRFLPAGSQAPARLHEAMRYTALGGGKRVRPLLVHASGALFGADADALARAASAVEMIHVYSLVHDDMPCMDDDALRRGKPTVHVAYDEATALLVGDALQAQAFEVLAGTTTVPAARTVTMLRLLAEAAGSKGMCGGQAIDLDSVGISLTLEQLERMHQLKTGAMLRVSVLLGALAGRDLASHEQEALGAYSRAIGLAFQVVDDILDATADSATLGKTAGKDAADNKPTYVSILGLEPSKALAEQLRQQAHDALAPFGEQALRLREIADLIVQRKA